MEFVLEAIDGLGLVQTLAFLFALAYIFFAARNSIVCWIFGILSSGLWAFEAWIVYGLLYDSLLNIFYVVMGGVGWWKWAQKKTKIDKQGIIQLPLKSHLMIVLWGGVLSILAGVIAEMFTGANLPYIDAPTTIFSIIATFLLIRKDIGNWIYWIIVDTIYVGIYIHKAAFLFAVLFVIYTLMAIVGWLNWRKILLQQS